MGRGGCGGREGEPGHLSHEHPSAKMRLIDVLVKPNGGKKGCETYQARKAERCVFCYRSLDGLNRSRSHDRLSWVHRKLVFPKNDLKI